MLRVGGATALAGIGGSLAAGSAWSAGAPHKLTFAWSAVAFCLSPVVVAQERGIFEKNGLQVELLNWGGSTDQLLEALATGKADVGVGLIHRWLKPLESGFDVKVIGAAHGGCLRMVGAKQAGVTDWKQLKGKTIGVSDLNSPAKNFFAIHLAKRGVNVDKDIEWRVYPADLLDVAVKKGEIQAIADGDPNIYLIEKRNQGVFTEIGNSGIGEYKDKICCIVGARGDFVRNNKPAAAAVVRSIIQASEYVAENPNEAAKLYAKYSPKVPVEDLRALLTDLTYHNHPTGSSLRSEVEYFAKDFHTAGVLKKSTDPVRFANHVTVDVLA
jgi:NitT/TauT family transport system substrate-binding protein